MLFFHLAIGPLKLVTHSVILKRKSFEIKFLDFNCIFTFIKIQRGNFTAVITTGSLITQRFNIQAMFKEYNSKTSRILAY